MKWVAYLCGLTAVISLHRHAYELINNIRPNFNGTHILKLIELPETCFKHLSA